MAEERTDGKPADGTESHDPDFPEAFLSFMRQGWRDTSLPVGPRPEVPHHAKRRAALSAAFPGETLVIPTGTEKVRANDTDHPFRPGSDFAYLTGDHDPDSVLAAPTARGTTRRCTCVPFFSRETDEFFRSRHGELWVGRRQTLTEKSTELGLPTEDLSTSNTYVSGAAAGQRTSSEMRCPCSRRSRAPLPLIA